MASVEFVYCPENESPLRAHIAFVVGMTVRDVLNSSGWLEKYPNIMTMPVGIFARKASLDTLLKAGDRVELYRPLTVDPMETRRKRARKT